MLTVVYRSLVRVAEDGGCTVLDIMYNYFLFKHKTALYYLFYILTNAVCNIISMHCLIDLENFKTQTRSAVNVREGQGVVLLCGTPMHSGGKADYSHI